MPARIAAIMSEVVTGLSLVLHHGCRSVRRAGSQFSSEGEEVDGVKEKTTQVNSSLSRSVIQSRECKKRPLKLISQSISQSLSKPVSHLVSQVSYFQSVIQSGISQSTCVRLSPPVCLSASPLVRPSVRRREAGWLPHFLFGFLLMCRVLRASSQVWLAGCAGTRLAVCKNVCAATRQARIY